MLLDSGLPQLERWHSLFPLDTNNRKNTSSFGYPSWVYKAQNSRTGRYYALRRLEGTGPGARMINRSRQILSNKPCQVTD